MHPRHIGEGMLRMGIQLLAPSWHQQTGAKVHGSMTKLGATDGEK